MESHISMNIARKIYCIEEYNLVGSIISKLGFEKNMSIHLYSSGAVLGRLTIQA